MFSRQVMMDLFNVHQSFRDRMSEIIKKERTNLHPSVIIDDFFEICIHRASDSVPFFEDAGTQKRHLHPMGIPRTMVSGHMQDIFFDEFINYVFESNYFDNDALESRFVHNDIASVCVHTVGEILRVIMNVVAQLPEGQAFFHPDSATLDMTMTDLIICPIPHRRDVEITVRFEIS